MKYKFATMKAIAEKYYNSVSDTYGVTVEEILKLRAEYIAYLNEF